MVSKPSRPAHASPASCLPFGKPVSLASISGPAYVTAQVLVQQVAYKLSDKIYSYSPQTFGLDAAAHHWAAQGHSNIHGYAPGLLSLQSRAGAGALALGYIFSPDFDLSRRHVPQTLMAPSGSLHQLRPCLDQLSLLYNLSSPLVAHVAAIDYSDQHGLVCNYDSALRLAEDVGMGLVATSSAYEAQHMSLLATLVATLMPTMHVYDGTRVARETLRVVDALGETELADLYSKLAAETGKLNPRLDLAGKTLEILSLVNHELGTVYEPFEYHGHDAPDVVLVVFGSAEAQVARQLLVKMAADGTKVGLVNVRIYRPFIEEAFLKAVPQSARVMAVLGQVEDEAAVADAATQSALYRDVLTTANFSALSAEVRDIKYSPSQTVTPQWLAKTVHALFGNSGDAKKLPLLVTGQQYKFWDVDDSPTADLAAAIGAVLSREPTTNVFLHTAFDNGVQGGIVGSDIRASNVSLEAPYEVDEADVVGVGHEKLLEQTDVVKGAAQGAKVLVRLSDFEHDEAEKRFPPAFRKTVRDKAIDLFVVDTGYSPAFEKEAQLTKLLVELCMLKMVRPQLSSHDAAQQLLAEGHSIKLDECVDGVDLCLSKVEVPASWAEAQVDHGPAGQGGWMQTKSLVPFDKDEAQGVDEAGDDKAVAKGLVFKEAYGTSQALRPDVSVKTTRIRVKETRRLTPSDYERNILHIEFDLGDSGLTYKIGEALGIHAENDEQQVTDFMAAYGIEAGELVQVAARGNEAMVEVRTAQQALMQNLDILGKPPKRFYEALAAFATDQTQRLKLEALGGAAGAEELKRRSDVDTATYVDVLNEFASARPSLPQLARLVAPLKRREYSIASAQAVTPTSVALMIVVVDWVDSRGRTRYGQATRYLSRLQPGALVTASVKPSVMKLPADDSAPLIMAGLGTGLAPFRAFVQQRALQKAQGRQIGPMLLYLGARHQRQEYLYGEEWEAYLAAGIVTLVGSAFSRDQPHKIYIQDRMRQTLAHIVQAYVRDGGTFYLCGPTWPVPDVTQVLHEAIAAEAQASGRKLDPAKEIERLKDEGRYVLEVY
ncbi:hypothetical protein CDD82_6659 [Ophiocordyceps australis]|uniref:assimilatory sulfite reductase (NADPH) n=1 Tax=Ophiocordyceps australis TaxID=1399860 RepID=A0A2C5YVA5_9HYPO|nr:hypothetical protein CDD82_6659 [Ophiocordyceps australis]